MTRAGLRSATSWLGALDALPAHIAIIEPEGRIVAANAAWRAFARDNGLCAPDAGVGMNYLAVCDAAAARGDDDATAVSAAIRAVAAHPEAPLELERRYPCHSATQLRWFLVRIAAFRDAGAPRIIISHDNITAMVQAEAAHERAARTREHFLSLVSHELRTPITMIYGNARILRDRGRLIDRAAGDDAIADVESEATRLRRLVDNMLALSHADDAADIILEPMLVRPAIEAVAGKWRRLHPRRPFLVSLADALPPWSADAPAVELVLDNLISNACENSPAESSIEIDAAPARDAVAVRVSDRGLGLLDGEEEAIFDAFSRGGRKDHFTPGVGIGLTACRRLVEGMHGTISAARRDGGGTQVTFALPVAVE